jgi:DNA-binding NarL/FixJ family response regulator
MTRILVVDDHPVFRDGLTGLLNSLPDLKVVAAVDNADDGIALVAQGGVEVVLMDLNLPGTPGVEATAKIAAMPDAPAVLVVTMVDDDDSVVAAMRAGARGYVLKGASGDDIAAAVQTVAAGGAVFGAGVAAHILTLSTRTSAGRTTASDGLTDREREVLELLADGTNNATIARQLGLSVKTVQNYVSRILDKLQLSDRTQAALHARELRRE